MTFSSTSHFHQKQTQPSPVSPDIWQQHESELMTVGWSSVEIRWKWYWLSRKSRRRTWQSLKLFHQLREDKRPLSKWLQFQVLTRFITTPNLPDCRNIVYHGELPTVFSLFLSNSALRLLIYTFIISRAVCSCVGQAGDDGKFWWEGRCLRPWGWQFAGVRPPLSATAWEIHDVDLYYQTWHDPCLLLL